MIRKNYEAVRKMRKINEVGVKRIRRYVADHHPKGLENFDRNIALIKDYLIGGPEYCAQKYGLTPNAGSVMLRIFYNYALEAEKEDGDG